MFTNRLEYNLVLKFKFVKRRRIEKMIFFRREDLDAHARFNLALAMYNRGVDDWGLVTELANRHNVSREFLYKNARLIEDAFQPHAAGRRKASPP